VIRYFILCHRSQISRVPLNLRRFTDRTYCVSKPCRNGPPSFAPARRMLKTIRDPEGLLKQIFAMLFSFSSRRIHTLHPGISARLCSLQKQQLSAYWQTLGWCSIRIVGSRIGFQRSEKPIEWPFHKRCYERWTTWRRSSGNTE
jgi:hypothetical protein